MRLLDRARHFGGPAMITLLGFVTLLLGPPMRSWPRDVGLLIFIPLFVAIFFTLMHDGRRCLTCRSVSLENLDYYVTKYRIYLHAEHTWQMTVFGGPLLVGVIFAPFLSSGWGAFAIRIAVFPIIAAFYYIHWIHDCLKSVCPDCLRERRGRR